MPSFAVEEFAGRMRRLQGRLREQGIELAVLTVNTDLVYYSGSSLPLYLLVSADGGAVLLARKALARIAEESPQLPLEPFLSARELPEILERHGMSRPAKVGYTLENTAYATVARWQRLFPDAETADLSWDIRALRMVKSPAEIAVQRRAGEAVSRLPELIRAHFRPGITEVELSAAIEYDFRLHGHAATVRCRREGIEGGGFGVCVAGVHSLAGGKFDGVCAGPGLSPAVPLGPGPTPIERGAAVTFDYAFNLDGYLVDMTRMACWGAPPAEVQRAYDAMLDIHLRLLDGLRPGRAWEDVYREAAELADAAGYADGFMGLGPEKVRFIGHGIGLELDEPPFLAPKMRDPLATGMVVALEPKVALPHLGVVGVEDTVVIGEGGVDYLTTAEREIIVVG